MDNKIVASIVGVMILVTAGALVGLSYARSCYDFIKQSKKNKEEEPEIENVQYISEDVAKPSEVKKVDAATQSEVQSVRGLQNLGNTCYFNSTMQALVHTKSVFREKLDILRTKGKFIREVLTFLSVMHSDNSRPYSPNNLHHLFGEKSPRFANYRQHDSHECLRNFLDNIRKEEREISGAVDKRKVLTVVDSVFGGHFITVYICEDCRTPYHVFEALLDISLPIMIDEEDLAAMNSARSSREKKSRTVMLQARGSKRKHHASQTDKLNEDQLITASLKPDYESTALEDDTGQKAGETMLGTKLVVTSQQNATDKTPQLEHKAELTEIELTIIHAQPMATVDKVDSNLAPETLAVQDGIDYEADELHCLNDKTDDNLTHVVLERTQDAEKAETLKENSSDEISRMCDPRTDSDTYPVHDNLERVPLAVTNLIEVYRVSESDAAEEKESRRASTSEEAPDATFDNSCCVTEAQDNLRENSDAANGKGPFQEQPEDSSIGLRFENVKENEEHELANGDERLRPTKIQEHNEEQEHLSDEQQLGERHEHHQICQQHSHPNDRETEQEQHSRDEKDVGRRSKDTELGQEQRETEDVQHIQNPEQDKQVDAVRENSGEHLKNSELAEKHQPDEQHYNEGEQQDGLHIIRNTGPKGTLEEETLDQLGQEDSEHRQPEEAGQRHDEVRAQERAGVEQSLQKDDNIGFQKDEDVEDGHGNAVDDEADAEQKVAEDEDKANEEQDDVEEHEDVKQAKKNCNDGKEVKVAEERVKENDDVSFDEGIEDAKVAEQEEQEDDEEEEYHEAKEDKVEDEEQEEEEVDDNDEEEVEDEEEEEELEEEEEEKEEEKEKEEEEEEEVEEEEEAEKATQRLQQQQQQQPNENEKEYHEDEVVVEEETVDDDEDSDEEVYVEVVEEERDDYRVAIDELMTPLSLSSPCLPNDERATKKHVTVHDCLSYFTREEHITKEYLCNDCYARHPPNEGEDPLLTSATKQTLIFNPPAILTLHLKRFELKPGGSVKRNDMITYEELLDLAPYCSSMCLRNDPPCQNIWYSLYGVVVHHGSTLKSGHYTAYVKIKESVDPFTKRLQLSFFDRDLTRERLIEMIHEKSSAGGVHKESGGTWYCMNDSSFHKVSVKEVLNQEAYLLFYERMS